MIKLPINNQLGVIAPMIMVLFAGGFIVFSVVVLDRTWLKNPNQSSQFELAQKSNPVLTSLNNPDQEKRCDIDEDDGCLGDDEGDFVDSNHLAAAD